MNADGSGLGRGRRGHAFHQIHDRRAPDSPAFRKNGRTGHHRAVCAFFVCEQRNLQARLGESDLLQLVKILRLLTGAFVQDFVGERKEAATRSDLVRVRAGCEPPAGFLFCRNVLSQFPDVNAGKVELTDLFLQRHPAQQIVHALRDWRFRIQVDRRPTVGLCHQHQACRQGRSNQYEKSHPRSALRILPQHYETSGTWSEQRPGGRSLMPEVVSSCSGTACRFLSCPLRTHPALATETRQTLPPSPRPRWRENPSPRCRWARTRASGRRYREGEDSSDDGGACESRPVDTRAGSWPSRSRGCSRAPDRGSCPRGAESCP